MTTAEKYQKAIDTLKDFVTNEELFGNTEQLKGENE